MRFSLSLPDYLVIIFYFTFIWLLGFYASAKKKKGFLIPKAEFLLAGRNITLPLFIVSLVATWYGNILGVGEFVFQNGISAWFCFGLPYYIAGFLFAFFISKKIRAANVYTIPEQIRSKYGKFAGIIASLIVLIITIPAAYILMIGIIFQMFTGWDLWVCVVLGTILSLVYIFSGGFKADVFANIAQFIFMYLGFGVLLYFLVLKFGFINQYFVGLPAKHLKLTGDFPLQYIIVWYIIALQTFIDPAFHQRCSSAKTSETAKKGIIISVFFWMVFDFLTLSAGLYAKVLLLAIEPVRVFPFLGDMVLPAFWKGVFIVSMLAPVMAALGGYSFVSGVTIGDDLLENKLGKKYSVKQLTNFGLLITAIFGIILALSLQSPVQLIFRTASIAVPGLLFPLLISFSTKYSIASKNMIYLMLASSSGALLWTVAGIIFNEGIFRTVEPMVAGIIISLILTLSFIQKK